MEKTRPAHEALSIGILLSMVGGFLEAYTFLLRGGVFCNAQTGNIVLMTISMVQGDWTRALYYPIPIAAFFLGILLTAAMRRRLSGARLIAWEHWLLLIEIALLFLVGFLPQGRPDPAANVVVSFICSMQYNTFRQAQGDPYASTFCTNNLRLAAENLYRRAKDGDRDAGRRCARYLRFILCFCLGPVLGVLLAAPLGVHSIWACCGLLATALLLLFLMARRGRYSA